MITIERCPCSGNAHWIEFVTHDGRATEPIPSLATAKNAINVFVKDGEIGEDEAEALRAQLADYGLSNSPPILNDERKARLVEIFTNHPSEKAEEQLQKVVGENLMTQEDADEIRALTKKRRETPFTDEELQGLPEAIAIGGADGKTLLELFLRENRITQEQVDRIRAGVAEFNSDPMARLASLFSGMGGRIQVIRI